MSKKYIGITIGPIVKTLMLTNTPAGLWGASYIFSYYIKKLISEIKTELKIPDDAFVVPISDKEVETIVRDCPWAGLLHDRIIFERNESAGLDRVNQCIEKVKKDLAEEVLKACAEGDSEREKEKRDIAGYFADYLQVHAIEKEVEVKENPMLVLSRYLDALELGQGYVPKENKNYILDFLEKRDSLEQKRAENRNKNIKAFTKKIQEAEKCREWHFLQGENIITIDDIAGVYKDNSNANTQTKNYFALVKADGDNLGKVLKSMGNDKEKDIVEEIKRFSKKCFFYAAKAFQGVEEYGGKMIYAGGDDLLFIAPVKNQNKTIFHLLRDLNSEFTKHFGDFSFKEEGQDKKMGFSAGVMICYYKYPLNEALKGVYHQLEKSKEVKTKNTISVHFEKHSGRQRGIQFRDFFRDDENDGIYDMFLRLLEDYSKPNNFLRSVGKKLQDYQKVFVIAMTKDAGERIRYLHEVSKNLFEEYSGIFDTTPAKEKRAEEADYIEIIVELLRGIFEKKLSLMQRKMEKIEEEEAAVESLQEIEAIIGLLGFYNEKEIG